MDTFTSLIAYSSQEEPLPADVYAFTVVCLIFLGAFIQNITETMPPTQPLEVLAGELDSNKQVQETPLPIPTPSILSAEEKVPRVQITGLEDIILGSLHKKKGLRSKDLVPQIRTILPEITKSDINSCLYKLLTRKQVQKSCDGVPLWTRVM